MHAGMLVINISMQTSLNVVIAAGLSLFVDLLGDCFDCGYLCMLSAVLSVTADATNLRLYNVMH